jgi:NAD(P)-dependent dehydrogenase (short-subunit alcohol dehydrogenase family)
MKKVVLISGGSSGIGRAAALCFSQYGYKVYEMSRREPDHALPGTDPMVHLRGDVTSESDCRRVVQSVIDREQRLDVLICNAGMGIAGSVEFASTEDLQRQMDVNFFGTVRLVQAVLPQMRRQQEGSIILVGSLAGVFPIPYQSFYSASKAAVGSMASALRNEVKSFGIRVSCLLPGDVQTGFTAARRKNPAGAEVYSHMEEAVSAMERDERQGMGVDRVARKLVQIAQCSRPYLYYTVGWKYRLLLWARKLVPDTLICYVLGRMY